jgi:septal ring-binding cell division protein DamX
MAIDTHKYTEQAEYEARHSALREFSRDERRPAVLLLSALVIAALFFAIGIMVGRWTAEPNMKSDVQPSAATNSATASATVSPTPQPNSPASNTNTTAAVTPSDAERRFTLLVATYDTLEKAQPLIKSLEEAGYTNIRTLTPRGSNVRYSVLVGRFTLDEARQAANRMRATNDRRLKYAKVMEDSRQ